ncbi:MAG: SPW repeat protein, partial [Balneolales bacterium]
TRTHGFIDYLVGVVLILAPWLLGFAAGGAETWVPVIIGAGVILYSMLTDYEMGISRQISMDTHLTLDAIGGIILAVSPWLFGFAPLVWVPHLVVGAAQFLVSLMTERAPSPEHRTRAA